ncbi:MAG: hypothetical protein RBS36_04250 [Thiomicrospira sp.]|jgi:hypothetical protein|nr:hypothetical protein [Thiomicrospira sp.]
MQTKMQSAVESGANIFIGYLVAVFSQIIIFPLFDIFVSTGENLLIAFYFTLISFARVYLLRRFFNAKKAGSNG